MAFLYLGNRAPNTCEPFAQEISRRRFPKALRPTRVFRQDGAHMSYEHWFFSDDYTPIVGMLFEDGKSVGDVTVGQKPEALDG